MADYTPFAVSSGGDEQPIDSTTDTGSDSGSGPAFFLGGGSDDRGDGRDAAGSEWDPELHYPDRRTNADGSFTKRKRRRKSNTGGSSNGRRADNSTGVETLARMLGIVHLGIASAVKAPEFALTDDESKALAQATATVLEEFDWTPDPKVTAVVGLVTTAGTIYGPKYYFYRERKKEEKLERDSA